ncbi:MAG: pyridoxal-phosphate dependent enzyme [Woeseiaceae bacterium]|nr:pyridoxal-phosphate dependent enzyme [Woeseiaceae bacterium]
MLDGLPQHLPGLAGRIPRMSLAELPTPLEGGSFTLPGNRPFRIAIKRDDLTGRPYGGNKVRKLEFLLARARERGATRVATFGTVASNHALATAIYAQATGFACTCFLSHQTRTPKAARTLNHHLELGTEIVRYGGPRPRRIETLRRHLCGGPRTWVIPMGGSCWLGALGFVDAGLELAGQLESNGTALPARVYVANGTMGTTAGLALGLVLAGFETEVHAVRVTHETIANPAALARLVAKTATMLHAIDTRVPADLAARARIVFRDGFFAGGYARSDAATDAAVALARGELGLELDTTYTGKAMAALVADARETPAASGSWLFWNTFNSRPLPKLPREPLDPERLPGEFLRYFEGASSGGGSAGGSASRRSFSACASSASRRLRLTSSSIRSSHSVTSPPPRASARPSARAPR